MAKISKLHRYAVLWLNSQAQPIETIINETGLSLSQVNNILSSTVEKEAIQTNHSPVKSKAHQLMINESVGKRQKVSIMTKEASQVAEEDKKKYPDKHQQHSYIFKPSENN